jgi:hypothetical protein
MEGDKTLTLTVANKYRFEITESAYMLYRLRTLGCKASLKDVRDRVYDISLNPHVPGCESIVKNYGTIEGAENEDRD